MKIISGHKDFTIHLTYYTTRHGHLAFLESWAVNGIQFKDLLEPQAGMELLITASWKKYQKHNFHPITLVCTDCKVECSIYHPNDGPDGDALLSC